MYRNSLIVFFVCLACTVYCDPDGIYSDGAHEFAVCYSPELGYVAEYDGGAGVVVATDENGQGTFAGLEAGGYEVVGVVDYNNVTQTLTVTIEHLYEDDPVTWVLPKTAPNAGFRCPLSADNILGGVGFQWNDDVCVHIKR